MLAYLERADGRHLELSYHRHCARESLGIRSYCAAGHPESPGVRVLVNEFAALLDAIAAVERIAEAAR